MTASKLHDDGDKLLTKGFSSVGVSSVGGGLLNEGIVSRGMLGKGSTVGRVVGRIF